MNLEELRKYKPQIEAIAGKYGVTNIRVFGSVVRGDESSISHLPVLRWMLKRVQHDKSPARAPFFEPGCKPRRNVILNLFQDPSKLRSAAERRTA